MFFTCYPINAENATNELNDQHSVGACHEANLAFPSKPRPIDVLRGGRSSAGNYFRRHSVRFAAVRWKSVAGARRYRTLVPEYVKDYVSLNQFAV
jgi:hypothetical protein